MSNATMKAEELSLLSSYHANNGQKLVKLPITKEAREEVAAKQLLMVNPSQLIMGGWRCYAKTKWCLALRSVLSTSGIWPI